LPQQKIGRAPFENAGRRAIAAVVYFIKDRAVVVRDFEGRENFELRPGLNWALFIHRGQRQIDNLPIGLRFGIEREVGHAGDPFVPAALAELLPRDIRLTRLNVETFQFSRCRLNHHQQNQAGSAGDT